MSKLIEQLKRTSRLPTPPGAAAQILRLAQEQDVSLAEVADTLAADPALSLRILKYANSALVGVSREITSVREAVVLLGMRAVRMMALSFSLVSADDRRACPGFDYNCFWACSLAHAVVARFLAKQDRGTLPPEEAFAAGLLANVGKLVFAVAMPQEYAEVLAQAGGTLRDTADAERERFGCDFREAGSELLIEWGIPTRLAATIKFQSYSDLTQVPGDLQPLVSIINRAWPFVGIVASPVPDDQIDQLMPTLLPPLPGSEQNASDPTEIIAVDPRRDMVLSMRREFSEIAALLSLDRSSEMDVSAIQAEAGEALTELSLAAQLHREAIERENKGLQAKAWTDGLTGIANRAAFDARLEELWCDSLQNGRSIALAILDIDHFKKFNDNFGHRTGDAVLRAVAQYLPPCLRDVDFLARYGGEEFAIIMPNADRLIAAGICVSLRRAVEQQPVPFEGKRHRVTISLGAVVLPSPSRAYSPHQLIEAADQQLYRSKDKGRNCCSMRELPCNPDRAALIACR